MALVEWNEQLSVGVLEMDTQHKRLIEMINRLHGAMAKGEGAAVLKTIVNELVTYTKVHFASEERLLASRQYPGLAAHKQLHEHFTAKVVEMQEKIQAGKMVTSVGVGNFLQDWLVHHIQQEDKRYGRHLCGVAC
ncbi:MAG TPA: bacteriohemerythrin [Sedimentisphaerales bacterium]|nr:bacteriohemerythrin [Sedimentisphaerales bacterium]HQG49392.1 bacteriohemerythrin [Sedimentisphaerales bacterium]